MTATAAASTNTTSKAKKTRNRRPWTPDDSDREIFEYVRMGGQTQAEVALRLGISQSTVSRVVMRFERWQARAKPREAGRLEHGERLRSQRVLTFERNELLLASCLRMAARMESNLNYVHKLTRQKTGSDAETISSSDVQLDSCGVASRFLRLAFRINMEQLKLVNEEELPELPPLSAEELEEEELAAEAASAELRAAIQKTKDDFDENHGRDMEYLAEVERLKAQEEAERAELARELRSQESGASGQEPVARNQESEDHAEPAAAVHNVHKLHKENGHASAASTDEDCTYTETRGRRKNSPRCMHNEAKGQSEIGPIGPLSPMPWDS